MHTGPKGLPEATLPAGVFAEALEGAAWAVVTNIGIARPLLDVAGERGVPVAVDVHAVERINDEHNAAWMTSAEAVFCSHERLPCSPAEWASAVIGRYGCAVVVVGMGAGGVLVAQPGGRVFQVPVTPRPVINTVGAGDALAAAFLHSYTSTGDVRAAAEQAAVFAGWRSAHPQGRTGSWTRVRWRR